MIGLIVILVICGLSLYAAWKTLDYEPIKKDKSPSPNSTESDLQVIR